MIITKDHGVIHKRVVSSPATRLAVISSRVALLDPISPGSLARLACESEHKVLSSSLTQTGSAFPIPIINTDDLLERPRAFHPFPPIGKPTTLVSV